VGEWIWITYTLLWSAHAAFGVFIVVNGVYSALIGIQGQGPGPSLSSSYGDAPGGDLQPQPDYRPGDVTQAMARERERCGD